MYKSIIVLGLSAAAMAWESSAAAGWATTTEVAPTATVTASQGWGESVASSTVTEVPVWTSSAAAAHGWTSSAWATTTVAPAPATTWTSSVAPVSTYAPAATPAPYTGAAGRVELGMGAAAIMVVAALL